MFARAWRLLPQSLQWRVLWLLNPKFVLGVTGVVLDEQGRVLLLKHTFRRRYPWGLLSGWVKRGESLEQALRREAEEETSLTIVAERLISVRTDRYRIAMEVVYLCRCTGGAFRPSNEVTEIRWCSPDALPPGLHPHHHLLIQQAAASAR